MIKEYIVDGTLKVKIKPNSSKNQIKSWDKNRKLLKININTAPEKGKANKELIKFLSKKLNKKIRIIRGKKSRVKILSIG